MSLDLLRQLRAIGVKAARLDGGTVLEVEFFPAEAPPAPPDMGPIVPKLFGNPAADACRCGHAAYEHAGDGYCLRGCLADKCVEPKSDEPEKTAMTSV